MDCGGIESDSVVNYVSTFPIRRFLGFFFVCAKLDKNHINVVIVCVLIYEVINLWISIMIHNNNEATKKDHFSMLIIMIMLYTATL